MIAVVVPAVTVETTIGVRVTTLTMDGWLSSVMTRGAFSSCARVLSYRAWRTAFTVTGPRMTLVPEPVKLGEVLVVDCEKVLNGLKPNVESRLLCAAAERLNPFLPKVDDQSTPVNLSPLVVMLMTRTWMEIWRLGTSTDRRYRAIFGITVSLSLTTIVLICGSSD